MVTLSKEVLKRGTLKGHGTQPGAAPNGQRSNDLSHEINHENTEL